MSAIAMAVVTAFLQNGGNDFVKLIQALFFCQRASVFCRRRYFLGNKQARQYRSDHEHPDPTG